MTKDGYLLDDSPLFTDDQMKKITELMNAGKVDEAITFVKEILENKDANLAKEFEKKVL